MGLKITKEDVEYANNKLHEILKENKKDRHVVIRNCLSDLDLSQADINYINSLVDKRLKKKNKEEKKREKIRMTRKSLSEVRCILPSVFTVRYRGFFLQHSQGPEF